MQSKFFSTEKTWEQRKAKIKAFQDAGEHFEAVKEGVEEVHAFVKSPVCVKAGVTANQNVKEPLLFCREVKLAGATAEELKQLAEMYFLRAISFKELGSFSRALPELDAVDFLYDMKDAATRAAIDECLEKQRQFEHEKEKSKVPVTILTGFLGSGKTTLLNRILKAHHGKKFAVIENELGAIGIDNQLLEEESMKKHTEESVTVLDNGCLCCSIRDDLVKAIKQIVQKADSRALAAGEPAGKPPLDGILIETTGMADPGPICKTFWSDEVTRERCKMDGVLTIVDAKHFLTQLKRERSEGAVNESAQQVAFADKVVCNKIDLVTSSEANELEAIVRSINATVPLLRCSLKVRPDEFKVEEITRLESFNLDRVLKDLEEPAEPSKKKQKYDHGEGQGHGNGDGHGDGHGEGHGHGDGHVYSSGHGEGQGHGDGHGDGHSSGHGDAGVTTMSTFRHDTGVSTCAFQLEGEPLDMNRIDAMLTAVIEDHPENLYRYKGVMCIRERTGVVKRFVLQGVHDELQFESRGEWPKDKPMKSQLVFIGRELKKEKWGQLFDRCKVSKLPTSARFESDSDFSGPE